MPKIKAVQFLGFEARDDDPMPETRFTFDRLKWSAEPDWLKAVANAGRLRIERHGPNNASGRLIYHAADDKWSTHEVEENGWLVDLGGKVLRVVDNATFEAVRKAVA